MSGQSILIADNNPYILDSLPPVLADSFPHLSIDICDSQESFPDKLRKASYDTIAMSPLLIADYPRIRQKQRLQLLAPLLVTASIDHPLLVHTVLETDAFDVILSPLHPTDAVQTVRMALWQSKLLHLLTSKDRAVTVFEKHMAAFPTDWKAEEEYYARHLAALDGIIKMLQSGMRQFINLEDEQALIDVAASVVQCAKQRSLDRLLALSKHATT